jgi:hypothetical protein
MDAPVLLTTLRLTWYRRIDIMYKVHTPIIPKVPSRIFFPSPSGVGYAYFGGKSLSIISSPLR